MKRKIKVHDGWRYPFIRQSIEEVVARYNLRWPRGKAGTSASSAADAERLAAAATAAAAAMPAAQ